MEGLGHNSVSQPITFSSTLGRWRAHFDLSYTDGNTRIGSSVPGPVTSFRLVLGEGSPLPDSAALEIGAQTIAETTQFIPVKDQCNTCNNTYEIKFFKEDVLLPLHKLFFHFVEVRINGSGTYEGSSVTVYGKQYLTIDNPIRSQPTVGEPFHVDIPGVEKEQIDIKPWIGDVHSVIFDSGLARPLVNA